jgi:flavin reductase (DIM6/NTAB) family NADH-FMN oxidoreductase RutF
MNAAVKHPVTINGPTLKDAMRQVAGGVCVITAGLGDERTGLTATSAVSLSVEPPTMIVCVNLEASALPIIQSRRHFCVNVLARAIARSPIASPAAVGQRVRRATPRRTGPRSSPARSRSKMRSRR